MSTNLTFNLKQRKEEVLVKITLTSIDSDETYDLIGTRSKVQAYRRLVESVGSKTDSVDDEVAKQIATLLTPDKATCDKFLKDMVAMEDDYFTLIEIFIAFITELGKSVAPLDGAGNFTSAVAK